MTIVDKVVEQGDIESQSTVTGNCEIQNGESKVIFLAPEGSQVKKGDIVVKFDPSEFVEAVSERESRVNEQLAEVETAKQELAVQKDENQIAIRKAKQTLEFAEIDLKKYVEGDYKVKLSELEGSISEAKTARDKARRDRDNIRVLVKKGFREYEQLREADQVVKSAEIRLTNSEQKLDTLVRFEHSKSLAEFEGKLEEAKYSLKIAETTATAKEAKAVDRLKNEESGLLIQKSRLKVLKDQLKKHSMTAPQDGTLIYARNDWRGNGEKIHEGSMIYQNQPVFILPDMKRMQVKVGIHETVVSKVKPKQKAVIRIDAFSGVSLTGEVESVSALAASTPWERSKNYSVIVTIDSFPDDISLRPGMTGEVEILVGEYRDLLAVPIQAVTSFGRSKYVFVLQANGKFEPFKIETGRSNMSFVEITSGLNEGQTIALDAYQRGLAEFSEMDEEEEVPGASEILDSNQPIAIAIDPGLNETPPVAVESETPPPGSSETQQPNASEPQLKSGNTTVAEPPNASSTADETKEAPRVPLENESLPDSPAAEAQSSPSGSSDSDSK